MKRLILLSLLIFVSSCGRSPDGVDIKTDIISIQLVDNNQGGHEDILFQIHGVTDQRAFDSYFFALALERDGQGGNLALGLARLFEYWDEKTRMMQANDTVFLPIDFSDEYTGCLMAVSSGDSLTLRYGFSRIMGLDVNPLDPGNFHKEAVDFKADADGDITVHQDEWNKSLDVIIKEFSRTN